MVAWYHLNYLFLTMGGIGSRFGSDIPKQFTIVDKKPIFVYIIEAYCKLSYVDYIILIVNKNWIEYTNKIINSLHIDKPITIVPGGATRSESIKNAICSIKNSASLNDLIFVHDATHPYLDEPALLNAIELMNSYDGVTLCQREYDTCYEVSDTDIVAEIPKKKVISGASPEIFRYGLLYDLYSSASLDDLESMSSVGALVLSNGYSLGYVPMNCLNIKITCPKDLALFELLCGTYYFGEY